MAGETRLLFRIHRVVGILQEFSVLGVVNPYVQHTGELQQAKRVLVGDGNGDIIILVREELIPADILAFGSLQPNTAAGVRANATLNIIPAVESSCRI